MRKEIWNKILFSRLLIGLLFWLERVSWIRILSSRRHDLGKYRWSESINEDIQILGLIACFRDTTITLTNHTSSGARSTTPYYYGIYTRTLVHLFHGTNECVCIRGCTLFLTLSIFSSFFFLLALSDLLSRVPYCQLVRPCGRTGESNKRQGHLKPQLQNQEFHENHREPRIEPWCSINCAAISCARFY